MDLYIINIAWFLMGCAFGIWMYFQGAIKGTTAGINAAIIFMVLNGRQQDVGEFVEFVNKVSAKKLKIDK